MKITLEKSKKKLSIAFWAGHVRQSFFQVSNYEYRIHVAPWHSKLSVTNSGNILGLGLIFSQNDIFKKLPFVRVCFSEFSSNRSSIPSNIHTNHTLSFAREFYIFLKECFEQNTVVRVCIGFNFLRTYLISFCLYLLVYRIGFSTVWQLKFLENLPEIFQT